MSFYSVWENWYDSDKFSGVFQVSDEKSVIFEII